ncbi:peptidase [Kaistia dalseonensis]|uniref:Proteasome-type protease n=1 Tax=Kaistia dalseonensis TaxID=410840 RepID=A0ABU0HBB6_9HYPH|nr:peptidase [Kaistia dalseonensis]MCX5496981.1 peptidase [Kaistia dalseonensis]MDQ0439607.1 putative proteasome-type protease [Kaistia dalseonensis]
MTYCVGILVREGLVMVADTRTNAGLDNIATFRKLHLFQSEGERAIAIATAGNLAVSQSVLNVLTEGIKDPETGKLETIFTIPTMFKVAQFVGRAIREVYRIHGKSMEQQAASFDVTMLLGGQVKGGRLRLFMVYSAGNFIEATADTPYLQIGEHKYGKPILDRAVTSETSLNEALKLGLVSMDSTIRSNLGVGMPIDIVTIPRDSISIEVSHRIDRNDEYFMDLRERWSAALRAAHQAIPAPPYGRD